MLRVRPRLVLVGLLFCGCVQSQAYFDDNVPLALEYVVAATVGDDGVIRRVSALRRASSPPAILRESGERVWHLGWDATLEAANVDIEALQAEPLIPRPDCRPGLPKPIWTTEISETRGQGPIADDEIPELSHPSLLTACPTSGFARPESEKPPDLLANTSIRNDCLSTVCEGGIEAMDSCRARIDLGRCVGQEQFGFVERNGELCVEEGFACRNTEKGPGAVMSLLCDIGPQSCRFDLFQPEQALQLDLEKLRLTPALPSSVASSIPVRVPLHAFHTGLIPDLAVGRERVVALTRDEATLEPDCSDEGTTASLAELGGMPLAVLSRSEPELPCMNVLAMDEEDQLYGVYGVHPELYFVRFDEAGAVVDSRLIPSSSPAARGAFVPVDLIYDAESQLLTLALHTRSPLNADRLVFASRDLRSVRTSTLSNMQISSVRLGENPAEESRLLVAESSQSFAMWWKPGEPMEESSAGLVAPSLRVTLLSAEPFGSGNVIGLFADETPAMARSRYGAIAAFSSFWFFEASVDGTTMVEFKAPMGNRRRLFIAGRERGSGVLGRALIAEYRDRDPRMVEAGARVLGEGIVTGGRQDATGSAWLALPWGGEVIRIAAPPLSPE